MSNRSKGKRGERWFINNGLKEIFPKIKRNANEQSQDGGVDLRNTGDFAFEVKCGKRYTWSGIQKVIDQAESQRSKKKYVASLIKPHRKDAYVIISFKDFLKLLSGSA